MRPTIPLYALILLTMAALLTVPAAPCLSNEPQESDTTESPGRDIVLAARSTLDRFSSDPNMGWLRSNIPYAKGVLIIPQLVRAGFVLGGSGGNGVLLARDGESGEWSYPAFFTMASGSFGFQLGLEAAEVVLMVMTDKGMDSMLSTAFKLGADASVAAGPVGAGARVQTADVIAFSRSKGLYGGISLEGAMIKPRDALNAAYYGAPTRPIDIIVHRRVQSVNALPLRNKLREMSLE